MNQPNCRDINQIFFLFSSSRWFFFRRSFTDGNIICRCCRDFKSDWFPAHKANQILFSFYVGENAIRWQDSSISQYWYSLQNILICYSYSHIISLHTRRHIYTYLCFFFLNNRESIMIVTILLKFKDPKKEFKNTCLIVVVDCVHHNLLDRFGSKMNKS